MGKSPRTVRLAAALLLTLGILTAHSQSTGGKTNSAEGTLSVSAVVETSVAVQIEPDGSMKMIVANAPDPIGNFASLVPMSRLEKQPAQGKGTRRRPLIQSAGAGSNTVGDAFLLKASSGTSSPRTAVFGMIPPNTLPAGESLAAHNGGASPSPPSEPRLVPGAPDQERARENFKPADGPSANHPGLRLEETADKTTAPPGSTLTYTVTFTNESEGPITDLKISNTTPPYTSFMSAICTHPLANNLTDCAVTTPRPGQTGTVQWAFTGTLNPSQSGKVSFTVKID